MDTKFTQAKYKLDCKESLVMQEGDSYIIKKNVQVNL